MKNIPTKIYLQVEEPADDFKDLHEVSWCEDRVNLHDIPYININGLVRVLSGRISDLEEESAALNKTTMAGNKKAYRIAGEKRQLKYLINFLYSPL